MFSENYEAPSTMTEPTVKSETKSNQSSTESIKHDNQSQGSNDHQVNSVNKSDTTDDSSDKVHKSSKKTSKKTSITKIETTQKESKNTQNWPIPSNQEIRKDGFSKLALKPAPNDVLKNYERAKISKIINTNLQIKVNETLNSERTKMQSQIKNQIKKNEEADKSFSEILKKQNTHIEARVMCRKLKGVHSKTNNSNISNIEHNIVTKASANESGSGFNQQKITPSRNLEDLLSEVLMEDTLAEESIRKKTSETSLLGNESQKEA